MKCRFAIGLVVALCLALCGMRCTDEHAGQSHANPDHDHKEPHDSEAKHTHDKEPAAASSGDGADVHDDHVDEVTLTPDAIKRWAVRVEPASKRVLTESITAPARIAFNTEAIAHVGAVVSGRVSRIDVRIGDTVGAGDVILVVVSPEWARAQSDYLQYRSAITASELMVKVSKSLYERSQSLYDESRGIALSEVQKRESEYRAAEGQWIASRGAAAAAENALRALGMDSAAIETLAKTEQIDPHYIVVTPIGGRIVERGVTLGESVGPDRDALAVVADLNTLWVIADVPEPRISRVPLGAKATVTVPAIPDRVFEGAVTYIGAQLDSSTRTVPVRIELRNDAGDVRPGMFAQAVISGTASNETAVAIQQEAVQLVEGKVCVFVPVEGELNTFTPRPVRVGEAVGVMVPVLEGLHEGDRYVAQGSFILKADLGKAGAAHEH